MRATVTKEFEGVKDGEVYPRQLLPGDKIEGDLARTAVAGGNADMTEDDTPEEKATRRRPAQPLPPQPNNPPSPAALGQAGLPPAEVMKAAPSPGTETALPAAATSDGGASTVAGPDTPTGGKAAPAPEVGRAEKLDATRGAPARATRAKSGVKK